MTKRKKPRPPEHLDDVARAKWREIIGILEGRGDVDQGHLDAAAAYATVWARWLHAEEQIKTLGVIVKSPSGFPTENPYLGVSKRALIELHRWGSELKLIPTRSASKQSDESTDPILKLIRQKAE